MKKQVLIIDDDKFNCLIYKAMLKDLDLNLDFAYNGQEGIEKYLQNNYSLVLLDMGLPIVAGYNVARAIRFFDKKNPAHLETPIIAVTANDSEAIRVKAIDAGVNEYLAKPLDIAKISDLILFYLAEPKPLHQAN